MAESKWVYIALAGFAGYLLLRHAPADASTLPPGVGPGTVPVTPGTAPGGSTTPAVPSPVTPISPTPSPVVTLPAPYSGGYPDPTVPPYVPPVDALAPIEEVVNGSIGATKAGLQLVDASGLITIENLGTILYVLGIAALVVDIGFTIAGDKPDIQKAVDVALDTAAIVILVALWETGIGLIIALVIEIVKFIFDLFAGRLFGGLTHEQREILERAKYAENLSPMLPEIYHTLSPRELARVLWAWGSGYCGGQHNVAMVVGVRGTNVVFGDPSVQGCPYQTATLDLQAEFLSNGGAQNPDLYAEAQVGISENMKVVFNNAVLQTIRSRCGVFEHMWAAGIGLDEMDEIAAEYRRVDALDRVAHIYAYPSWQALFAAIFHDAWAQYVASKPAHGSFKDFAQTLGYATAIDLRTAAFAGLMPVANRIMALEDRVRAMEVAEALTHFSPGTFSWDNPLGVPMPTPVTFPTFSPDQAVTAYLAALETRIAAVEYFAHQPTLVEQGYGSGVVPGLTPP